MYPPPPDDAATRAAVFNLLGTSPYLRHIAQRLAIAKENDARDEVGYQGHPRAFTHNPTADQRDWLHARMSVPDPVILDVTAGGGGIPLRPGGWACALSPTSSIRYPVSSCAPPANGRTATGWPGATPTRTPAATARIRRRFTASAAASAI